MSIGVSQLTICSEDNGQTRHETKKVAFFPNSTPHFQRTSQIIVIRPLNRRELLSSVSHNPNDQGFARWHLAILDVEVVRHRHLAGSG